MKRDTNDIDELIQKALKKDEEEFYNELKDETVLEMVGELFTGKLKWLNILVYIISVGFLGVAIWAAINFFQEENVKELLMWSGVFITCMLVLMTMKIWFWMQFDQNRLKREIKRLELQVNLLAGKLESVNR